MEPVSPPNEKISAFEDTYFKGIPKDVISIINASREQVEINGKLLVQLINRLFLEPMENEHVEELNRILRTNEINGQIQIVPSLNNEFGFKFSYVSPLVISDLTLADILISMLNSDFFVVNIDIIEINTEFMQYGSPLMIVESYKKIMGKGRGRKKIVYEISYTYPLKSTIKD